MLTNRGVRGSGRRRALGVLLAVALSCYGQPVAAAPPVAGGAARVKVRVASSAVATRLLAAGAERVASYDAFELLRVDAAEAARLVSAGFAPGGAEDEAVRLNVGALDTTAPEAQALREAVGGFDGKRLHLVQFAGPVQPSWYEALAATGVQVVQYIPANAYLVYGDSGSLAGAQALAAKSAFVQWDGAYLDRYKIQPTAQASLRAKLGLPAERDLYTVQLVGDPAANATTLALLAGRSPEAFKSRWESGPYVNVVAALPQDAVAALAAQPDVVSIDRFVVPQKNDERQDRIITGQLSGSGPATGDHLAYLAARGFTQAQFTSSGFVVDVTDSGIDNATTSPNHFGLHLGGDLALAGRVQYNRLEGTPNTGSTLQGCDGHGNLNSHIIAGYVPPAASLPVPAAHADASGFRFGLGVAPFVKVGSSVIFDPGTYTNPNLPNLASRAYNDNARISSNSWGANTAGAYTASSQTYDALVRDAQPATAAVPVAGNQEYVVVFSAGNAGSGAGTIGSPGSAKNVITVGAAEGVQAFGGADGCGIADSGADSANDIISFSSRGPTSDGRMKPDIVAPGTHISGGVFQATATTAGSGAAAACFDASGACAGPGGSNFFPTTQQFYTASSGTSHSAPAVAGAAALVRQHFLNNSLAAPSPAMTKAVLLNAARYLTGVSANDTLPSPSQGMGMLNLGTYFDEMAAPRILKDQVPADVFTASGQQRVLTGNVVDSGQPFRVTLAWTDAPGPTSGNAYVNNLDLEVTVGGNVYKGNVFTGAASSAGGSADVRNNVESVLLPAGVSGAFSVRVVATNIAGDGVPNVGGALDQDYALVVTNANEVAQPVVGADAGTVVSDSCSGGDGVLDPGEVATLSLCLRNAGAADSASVVGTLLATGGVTNPSGAQTYGVLSAGGAAVCRSFTLNVGSVTCGASVVATLQFQDGGLAVGSASWSFPTGQPATTLSESFDTVTAPALPAGWTTTSEAGADTWTTVATTVDSAPNAAFINNPATVSLTSLVSPVVALPALGVPAVLTFRNNYATENTYDGAVLELKIGAGAFQDILAAGGSFASGGYNGTLNSSFSNPLGGRQAWTGSSGGYITTTVNLPLAASGQSIQLRWRRGSDSSVSATGWRVDTISLVAGRTCCASPADVSLTKTDGRTSYAPGDALTYSIVASNAGPGAAGATVTDTLPAALTSASWTCAASPGSLCGSLSGSGNISAPVTLLSAGSATFTLAATVSSSAVGSLTNTATIATTGGVSDPVLGNNSATDVDSFSALSADLSITKTDGRTTYYPGQSVTYTLTVSNAGPNAAPGARVVDAFPSDLSGASWTCSASAGSSCASPGGSGNLDTTVDLLSGGSATFIVTASTSIAAPGSITNTATVAQAPGVADPNPANNTASDVDTRVGGSYYSVTPCRVLDTRNPAGPLGGPALTAGVPRSFQIAGNCGVPANATAVALNLTVTNATSIGNLRVYPTGAPLPLVSALNYVAGQNRANNGVYSLSAAGQLDVLCTQASGTTDAILDVAGFFVE